MSGNFTIEARSLSILGAASHDFWVLYDGDGNAIAELDGLAFNRIKHTVVEIGTSSDDSLRFFHMISESSPYASLLGNTTLGARSMYREGQTAQTVFSGTQAEAIARWSSAVNAIEYLNSLDLNYPPFGFDITVPTVNSNSAYRTFGELMGLEPYDFPWTLEPSLDYRAITPETINILKYKQADKQSSQNKLDYLLKIDKNTAVANNNGSFIG